MPKLVLAGFGEEGLASVIFILGIDAALSFAAKVLFRVEDLEADAARDAVVFARPRRGAVCSGGGGCGRCRSGDVMETARLSSLPGSVTTKPGGAVREAMTFEGAVGALNCE